MKTISILVPCYNEEENIEPMVSSLSIVMEQLIDHYDYEIIYRDNASTDRSLDILRNIAKNNKRLKVIANSKNYGHDTQKNTFRGRVSGDVIIMIAGDLQEPPELIPEFIKWYEKGYEAVCGQKTESDEGIIKFRLRQIFYFIIDTLSETQQYRNISGITLLSRRLWDMMLENDFSVPRFFLADLGCDVKLIQYKQRKRLHGKSKMTIGSLLAFSIGSLIETSSKPLRIMTMIGLFMSFVTFVIGVVYLVLKLRFWHSFSTGTAPLLIGIFFIGSIQLFCLGMVGEYVGNILKRVRYHYPPMVKELINFNNQDDPYLIKHIDGNSERNEA